MRSINKGMAEEALASPGAATAGRSESQSADLFQELQREVENRSGDALTENFLTCDLTSNVSER